jgi:hypothetical protein
MGTKVSGMKVSLDGGSTYVDAPAGVRVVYDDLRIPGLLAGTGELRVNCTEEGLVLAVWASPHWPRLLGYSINTTFETVDDLVDRLIAEPV